MSYLRHSDLRARMVAELEKREESGADKKRQFVAENHLRQIFTTHEISNHVAVYHPEANREALTRYIKESAMKTYAILLQIDAQRLILKIQQLDLDIDAKLFESCACRRSHCKLRDIEQIKPLFKVAERFYEAQWVFPPHLSWDYEIPQFDTQHFRFPFEGLPTRVEGGRYGEVYQVKISADYIKYPQEYDPKSFVAYKRVTKDKGQDWEQLKNEVLVLRDRAHPNVTPLFASFIAGPDNQSSDPSSQHLYMVMPLAITDMDSWMKRGHAEFESFSDQELETHIWEAIWGLSLGLASIHREDTTQVAYHGDIKPNNILLFRDQTLIWKFTDFGSARLEHPENTESEAALRTAEWAPEEFSKNSPHHKKERHGQLGDVWSLGCVFLLLATMLEHKWSHKGVHKFETELRKGEPFHARKDSVQKWIADLLKRSTQSRNAKAKGLLHLIREMLTPQTERLFSWEVNIDLFSILNPNSTDGDLCKQLRKVIESFREVDRKMRHELFTRAKEKKSRSESFLSILAEYDWNDDSVEKSTIKRKDTPSFPPPHMDYDTGTTTTVRSRVITRMEEEFSMTKILVLHGLHGVGMKSLSTQFIEHMRDKHGYFKRTADRWFVIDARSLKLFENGYQEIAKHYKFYNSRYSTSAVKEWIENEHKVRWIMHVCNLDDPNLAKQICAKLPVPGPNSKGRVLITTRNRALADHFAKDTTRSVEVEKPDVEESLKIFAEAYKSDILVEERDHAQFIVDVLWCPKLMKVAARHLYNEQIQIGTLKDAFANGKLETIEKAIGEIKPDLASWFLRPILTEDLRPDDTWSDELQILFLLSMYDCQIGLDMKLVRSELEMKQYGHIDQCLQTLIDCSLIRKERERYRVNSAVQLAVLIWIKNNEQAEGFLKRSNKALSMLFRYCSSDEKGSEAEQALWDRQRDENMAHFEHIAKYATVEMLALAPKELHFQFDDRAIQGILMFTEPDQREQSITMLELGHKYYSLAKIKDRVNSDERARGIKFYFNLNSSLIIAKVARNVDTGYSDPGTMENIPAQIDKLVEEAKDFARSSETWAGKSVQEWELCLLRIRTYRQFENYDTAQKLQKQIEQIRLKPSERGMTPQFATDLPDIGDNKILDQMKELAIRASMEVGWLNHAIGRNYQRVKNLQMAEHHWKITLQAFEDVEHARKFWTDRIHSSPRQLNEISQTIADCKTRVGNRSQLDQAIRELERVHQTICKEVDHNTSQACVVELSINRGKMRKGGSSADEARISLEGLLKIFQSGWGEDHAKTKECRELLEDPDSCLIKLDSRFHPALMPWILVTVGVSVIFAVVYQRHRR